MVKAVGYVDGVIDQLENIRVPVTDRGFLYGDSIYEVFRTYQGIPFMYDEHYERLLNSAKLIGMDLDFSAAEILDRVVETLKIAEVEPGEDVYVRYQITRGSGPIDLTPDPSQSNRLVIIIKAIPKWNPDYYRSGMVLAVPELRRNSITNLDPNIKGGNYLNNILGLAQAKQRGADDCVMLDANNNVTECSNSNVWFVINDEIVTPKLGNLVGLTRKSLVSLLGKVGLSFAERSIHYEELIDASECFVTSATREVMPVKRLIKKDADHIDFPAGGGELTRKCQELYQQMLVEFINQNHHDALY